MEEKKTGSKTKNVKKANLLDHNAIKHLLDESVSDIVTSRGYKEDVRLSNVKILLGTIIIVVALIAQFYNKKFPENRDFLMCCIGLYPFFFPIKLFPRSFVISRYVVLSAVMQLILYTKEKNAILFTYPLEGSFTSTGLVVSSKLPRFSDQYTLTIDSADPKSISAGKSVHFTKSVTQWLTEDGVLVEGLFWKDVDALIKEYTGGAGEPRKKK
ncbi:Signal peptidase complex subunit 2 [Cardamine amara subsp. amara]|uniref:Signal peptidase complex subunit 2 n=1 Tax=Cardamine amara subsp. amara TaxID=228776 RepID=A0ABD1AWD0_CARAN